MKQQQRGFVGLQRTPPSAAGSSGARAVRRRSRLSLAGALERGRTFVAGLLAGIGIWMPIFSAMNDEPGFLAAAGSLALFALAAVVAHRRA